MVRRRQEAAVDQGLTRTPRDGSALAVARCLHRRSRDVLATLDREPRRGAPARRANALEGGGLGSGRPAANRRPADLRLSQGRERPGATERPGAREALDDASHFASLNRILGYGVP